MRRILDKALQFICCVLFLLMTVIASWQVVSRYIFNAPSTITETMLRCLVIWLSAMSIAYVVGQREHVSLTLLTDRVNKKAQRALAILVELLFITFALTVFIYGGGKAAINSMGQLYPMLQMPKSIVYLPLVLSGGAIFIYSCFNCHLLYRSYDETEV